MPTKQHRHIFHFTTSSFSSVCNFKWYDIYFTTCMYSVHCRRVPGLLRLIHSMSILWCDGEQLGKANNMCWAGTLSVWPINLLWVCVQQLAVNSIFSLTRMSVVADQLQHSLIHINILVTWKNRGAESESFVKFSWEGGTNSWSLTFWVHGSYKTQPVGQTICLWIRIRTMICLPSFKYQAEPRCFSLSMHTILVHI